MSFAGVFCSWPGFLQPQEAVLCQQILDHADIDAMARLSASRSWINAAPLWCHVPVHLIKGYCNWWPSWGVGEDPQKTIHCPSGADILGSAYRGEPCSWALSCFQKVTDHTVISSIPWNFAGYSKTNQSFLHYVVFQEFIWKVWFTKIWDNEDVLSL